MKSLICGVVVDVASSNPKLPNSFCADDGKNKVNVTCFVFVSLFVCFFFSCGGQQGIVLKCVPHVQLNFLDLPIKFSLLALSFQIPLSMQTNTPIISATSQYVC